MSQILVRNVDPTVVEELKRRAKMEGRSLESQVKMILERAASEPEVDRQAVLKMLETFRSRFKGRKFPDSTELIRQDRESR